MNDSACKLPRKKCRQLGLVATVAAGLMAVHSASASIFAFQDVYNSVPMSNTFGVVLPGTNPSQSNECTVVPGCLVEILQGSNGVAHVANPDGSPGGGDTILSTSFIGQGETCGTLGEFSTAFSPAPASGTLIYGRVFNQPTVAGSTYWGQSAGFTSDGGNSQMDLSALGLKATTMPMGINLSTTVDSKGVTYYDELIANTNPQNPADVFATGNIVQTDGTIQVSLMGHVGRVYTLQRSVDMVTWSNITSYPATGLLTADTSVILEDPSPPVSRQLFYRVDVTMP